MSEFMAMVAANALPVGLLLGLVSMFAIYLAAREPWNYFFMDLVYGLPLVGKLQALSRDSTKSRKTGWLVSEEALCGDYGKYVNTVSEREFWRGSEYMRKAGDTGRKPLNAGMMILLGVLIAAESLGFSFLLSTAMAQEGSANLHTLMTFAVTLVLAIVFAYFMHAAGAQLHRSGLIGHAEKTWRDDGQSVDLTNGTIDLKTEQDKDDDKPDYVQLISRVGRNKSYGAVIGAGVLIALVAVGSTYMRIQHANSALVQEAITATDSGGNPFADGKGALPDEARASQDEALARARSEATTASGRESYAAFVVLGVIFVFTQFVGVMFGMKYGFAGSQGTDAYKLTRGFGTFDEYLRSFGSRIHTAEARLRNLQQRMASHSGSKALDLNGDFESYLRRRHFDSPGSTQPGLSPPATLVAATAPAPAAVASAESADNITLAQALAGVDALSDVTQKKAFTVSLPHGLRAEVISAMKARKAQAAALSELDDVF